MTTETTVAPEQLTDSVNTEQSAPTSTADVAPMQTITVPGEAFTAEQVAAALAGPVIPAGPVEALSEAEVLRLENERLKRELEAARTEKARAKELVAEIDQHDNHFEAARDEAKRAKKSRDEAKASLRALVAGEVNVKIDFDKKDDGKASPGATAPEKTTPVSLRKNLRPVQSTFAVSQFALTRDDVSKLDVSKLRPLEPTMDKRKVDALEAGPLLFVAMEQTFLEDGSGYFDAWPLIDAESWDVNFAKKYAGAIRDVIDEAPDVVARRKTGGELCGVTVKVAGKKRKRFVVGPDDMVARFVYGIDGGAVEAESEAAKLLPATLAPEKTAEVLAFPTAQIADRLEARLREYQRNSTGYREGAIISIASDLRVSEAEVAAAARSDDFRFEIRQEQVGAESREVVRLLVDLVAAEPPADEPEVLGADGAAT